MRLGRVFNFTWSLVPLPFQFGACVVNLFASIVGRLHLVESGHLIEISLVIGLKVLECSENLSLVVLDMGCLVCLPELLPLHIVWTVAVCWEERWPSIGILVRSDAVCIVHAPVVGFFVVSLPELLSAWVVGAVAVGREQDWPPVRILIGSNSISIVDSPVVWMLISVVGVVFV